MTNDQSVPVAEDSAITTVSGEAAIAEEAATSRNAPWFRLAVILLIGLFYAYDLFEAIGNTFGVVEQIAQYNNFFGLAGDSASAVPWGILVANMALPVVVFGLALFITRKRNIGVLAFVLLAGLGVNAALMLSFIALV